MTMCSNGKCSFWNELVPGGSPKVHAAININYFECAENFIINISYQG